MKTSWNRESGVHQRFVLVSSLFPTEKKIKQSDGQTANAVHTFLHTKCFKKC
jgi:hypothetical protein